MKIVNAYGTFTKENNLIHRNAAYLQWGRSGSSIGSFLLLNPGSAGAAKAASLKEGEQQTISIELDPTMKQIVYFIEQLYGEQKKLDGRVYLYNLFTLQSTKDKEAIQEFERLTDQKEIIPANFVCTVEELQKNPWLCIGWGVGANASHSNLKVLKQMWMNRIEESKIKYFGKKHAIKKAEYYHICPQISAQRPVMINNLLRIYEKEIAQNFSYENRVEFTSAAAKPNILIRREEKAEFDKFEFDFPLSGWSVSTEDPEKIVYGFSQLSVKKDYQLKGYQYQAGGNGNGIVWAIPADKELPRVEECEIIDDSFLSPPKPDIALDDFMQAIDGDKSPLSYLQAAICLHELYEFGAQWHGCSWSQDRILPYEEEEYFFSGNTEDYLKTVDEEIELSEVPVNLHPHFFFENGSPVIVFYTTNDIGILTVNRYTHVFKNNDYTQEVTREVLGQGGSGIIF